MDDRSPGERRVPGWTNVGVDRGHGRWHDSGPLVIVPTASAWAIGGELIDRLLAGTRARRAVSFVLAGLLVLTVVSVWI